MNELVIKRSKDTDGGIIHDLSPLACDELSDLMFNVVMEVATKTDRHPALLAGAVLAVFSLMPDDWRDTRESQ